MYAGDANDGAGLNVATEDAATFTPSGDEALRDFYYLDGLTGNDVVEDIYRRYLRGRCFSYFGNVLFYLIPDEGSDLKNEYGKHLFAENEAAPHLFALLNEVLRVTVATKGNPTISDATDTSATQPPKQRCNVFVYGDAAFAQMDIAKHAILYLTQRAHVIGYEPTGTMSDQVIAIYKLQEFFGDFASYDRLCRNVMITCQVDFDANNHLVALNMVPNLATDTSCAAVSAKYRKYLETRNSDPAFNNVVIRPPSVFYALLYSIENGKYRKWLAPCKMTPPDARRVLDIIPEHEIRDPKIHMDTLEQTIRLLLRIGFGTDEVRSIMQILAAVVLFDTYNIVRARIDEQETKKTEPNTQDKDDETNKTRRHSGKRVTIKDNRDTILNPKDILVFAAEVIDIPLLRAPANTLTSPDLLFRLDLLGANNKWQFDNIAPALFIRLKLAIYRRANRFLSIQRAGPACSSIAIHCNSGSFPQSLRVKQHGDTEIARRASEEAFVYHFSNATECGNNVSTTEFARRNAAAVNTLTKDTGLLAKIVLAAQKYSKDKNYDPAVDLGDITTVQHSWQNVEYDLVSIAKDEVSMFALPEGICKLLSYSSNQFVVSLLIPKRSNHTVYGTCAVALSYIRFLNDCVTRDDLTYHVVCTYPRLGRKIYKKADTKHSKKHIRKDEQETAMTHGNVQPQHIAQDVRLLKRALSTNIPIIDLCMAQREHSQVTLELEVALNTFMPIAYVALQPSMHRTIPLLEGEEAFRLMLHAFNVPDSACRIEGEKVTLKRSLCVKLMARVSSYLNRVVDSVRLIQSWWIGYNTIQLKRVLRRVVVRLQSRARQLIFRDHVNAIARGRSLSLDFIGYCLVVYHLKVSLQSSSHKTLQLLHSMEKRYHEKEYHCIQHAAATYIQACWRGRTVRRQYARMKRAKVEEFALTLVQATIRRFLATAAIVQKKPKREVAATRIQAQFRGYKARCRYEVLSGLKLALLSIVRKGAMLISLSEQLKFVKERKKVNSTTVEIKRLIMMQTNLPPGFVKAQNMIRMHFVRKQYLYLRAAIDKVQAIAMTKVARIRYLTRVKAAKTIQRWWRGVRKPGLSIIPGNILYYLNIREHAASVPLRQICNLIGHALFHFRAYQDIRMIYPRSWAAYPITLLTHLLQVQRSLIETCGAESPKLNGLQFAISAYHSLMLVRYSNGGGSKLYSWGGQSVLDTDATRKPNAMYMEKPLEFYQLENTDIEPAGRHKLILIDDVEIVSVACGNEFSLALDRKGRLFTWGNNRYGQCGQGHRLVNLWSPTLLPIHAVTGIWCGEAHSVIRLSVGEYFVFGRAFGYIIYAPEDIKAHCEAIRNQHIEAVACGGALTVLYTAELRYVLHVLGGSPTFAQCYNLRGNIKSICTNGRMISALVGNSDERGAEQRVLAWGQLRCFSRHFKEPLPNTAVLVNAFCEMFEHPERRKPRRSLIKVDSHLAKPCTIPSPTKINITKRVVSLNCDHQQLIMTCTQGVVLAVQTFELLHSNPSDIRGSDDHSIRLDPQVTNAQLEPGLYQFTALEKAETPIQIAYNRLSCSIGYVAGGTQPIGQ